MAFQTECKMSPNILSLNNWVLRESKTEDAKLSLGIFPSHKQNLKIQKTFQTPIDFTASSIKKPEHTSSSCLVLFGLALNYQNVTRRMKNNVYRQIR